MITKRDGVSISETDGSVSNKPFGGLFKGKKEGCTYLKYNPGGGGRGPDRTREEEKAIGTSHKRGGERNA